MGKPSKVFICGLKAIGKTTMLEQLLFNNLAEQDIHPTIEDIYVASVKTDSGTREILRFYDTEGIGTTDSTEVPLSKQFYSIADAFVLVYSIENRQSFEVVDMLKRDIDKNRDHKNQTVTIIIGLSEKPSSEEKRPRQVDPLFVAGWCSREKVKHFDCCIAERQTLFPPFVYLASKLNSPPPAKSFAPLGIVSRNLKAKE